MCPLIRTNIVQADHSIAMNMIIRVVKVIVIFRSTYSDFVATLKP